MNHSEILGGTLDHWECLWTTRIVQGSFWQPLGNPWNDDEILGIPNKANRIEDN